MLKKYNLMMPHAIYSGDNALENLGDIIRERGYKHVILITDTGVRNSGLCDLVLYELHKAKVDCKILDSLSSEPDIQTVKALSGQVEDICVNLIIACGGGSVMDTAKLISVLATSEYDIQELVETPLLAQKQIPVALIPTTSGTGAEVTPNAIVSLPEKEIKIGIISENMMADYVILDTRMVQGMPRRIAASTGIDALSHCLECFISNKANFFSDLFALEGLDLILNHIEKACSDPNALEDKKCMQLAALYGGIAITASGTTAVHALSYPLGGKYHIAHGIANAILLVPVMRFNEPVCRERLAIVYDRCCHNKQKAHWTITEKSKWVLDQLQRIVKHLDVPESLSELGIPKSDLNVLAHAGMETQRLLVNNPRMLTLQDAKNIYQEVM